MSASITTLAGSIARALAAMDEPEQYRAAANVIEILREAISGEEAQRSMDESAKDLVGLANEEEARREQDEREYEAWRREARRELVAHIRAIADEQALSMLLREQVK